MSDDALEAVLARAVRVESEARQTELEGKTLKEANDRTWIARIIVPAFALSVIIVIGLTFQLAWSFNEWEDAAKALLAVVAQVMLPIVTLVIGYYFGQQR